MLSRLTVFVSAPASRWDEANLRFQDGLNRRLPWLWWPISPPDRAAAMAGTAHGLYVAHASITAAVVRLPRRRPWAVATFLSWALFTGAWDRRANATAD